MTTPQHRRLPWLLASMLALAALRWWLPPAAEEDAVTAAAPASARPAARAVPVASPTGPRASAADPASTPEADDDVPGNAFAVRNPAPPDVPVPVAPPPPPQPQQQPVVEAPPPPPVAAAPEPPPFQVIGTWEDGTAPPGVFIATPQGTVLARAGTVLQAEYRIDAVTPHQVTLVHIGSQHQWQLPVTRAAVTP
jgi:hypothetical protein